MSQDALRFATAVRALGVEARRLGLTAPGFRTPPRDPSADRTMRRRNGAVIVAVRLAGRDWAAVLADMVEGVIAANAVGEHDHDRVRAALHAAVQEVPAAGTS